MPEGSEVLLTADLIRPLVVGKKVHHSYVGSKSRYKSILPDGLIEFNKIHGRIVSVNVRGKFMYWSFDNGHYLFNTFGMSGQWSNHKGKHLCFCFQFTDGSSIYFNDPRHFGTIKFTSNTNNLHNKLNMLGWDPLQMPLKENFDWIKDKLAKTNKPIAEVLMDQKLFAGIGNYLRSEVLYSIGLNPFRPSNSLTDTEINQLCQSAVDIMQTSYQHQGATISTYKTPNDEKGNYSNFFKVYSQKQDPLGNPVIKQDLSGRTLHWCPAIQQR